MHGGKRGIRSQDSRQRLIDGAVESILKVGYARTSVGELVKRAGLSKGAHVYHFKSKLDLIAVTVEHLFRHVNERLRDVVHQTPRSLKEVEKSLQAIAEITLDVEGSALLEVWMASRTDGDLRRIFARLEADNERVHEEWLVQIFGRRTVETTDLARLMDGVILHIRGLALQNILQKDAAENPPWKFWRRKFAVEIYACMQSSP